MMQHLLSVDVTEDAFRRWFGAQLRAARKAQGLSQATLARMLPGTIESGQIGGWERGEIYPRPANLAALITVLDTTPHDLFCSDT